MTRISLDDDQHVIIDHAMNRMRVPLKQIPGAFERENDTFVFPCTTATVDAILKALGKMLGSCEIDTRLALIASDPFRPRNIYATDLDEIPVTFTKPWRHQVQGFWFAHDRAGALFDVGLGAGKTKMASDLVLNSTAKRMLVLTLKSVVEHWPRDLAKHFTPGTHILAIDINRSVKERAQQVEHALRTTPSDEPLWIIMNHTSATIEAMTDVIIGKRIPPKKNEKWIKFQSHRRWDMVIVDEAHKISDMRTQLAQCCYALGDYANKRLALTGTPFRKTPIDVFGIARFVDKKVFGASFVKFRDAYANVDPDSLKITGLDPIKERDFEERLGRFSFHVDRSVLDLPDAQHIPHYLKLSTAAQNAHNNVYEGWITTLADGTITPANRAVGMLRAQQITSGYVKRDDGNEDPIDFTKLDALIDLFQSMPDDEPVVVFARFSHDMQTIRDACINAGRSCAVLDGKHNELSRWQAGEFNVIAVQIQAGGAGIDLTRACINVYFSVGYISPIDYDQSLARSHRPGQTRNVQYQDLICENSIDVEVYAAMQARVDIIAHLYSITHERTKALAS